MRHGILMELLEAVFARFGVDWIMNRGKDSETRPRTAAEGPSEQKQDKKDWHMIMNIDRFMPLDNRQTLDAALARLPERDRDRAEKELGQVLSDGRDGFVKARIIDATGKNMYPEGMEPEKLLRDFLHDSTASGTAADLFLARLLQKSLLQEAEDASKRLAEKARRFGGYALWILIVYLLLIVGATYGWVTCFSAVIDNPDAFSTLVWGLVWFALFALTSTPLAKAVLTKE